MASDRQLKKDEQERFRKILLTLRARLQGDVDQMTDEALNRGGDGGSGNLSSMPIHMADLGTDNFDQEFTLGLIENEQETLDEIEAALVRLDDGNFGRCGDCDKPIAKARLQALPYTRFCIECARAHENRVALG
ncbi:TraR/DksA family transcriptional regulator [Tautonia marina]|uniref:TraR/DksA family transcriptional regulator n=1 Tax=Tautonia marina TaxID=2653855 RepID=UPI0012607A59|nr:TraR/DksA C4-type zinc finger protein [Tautonia marina]